MFSPRILAVLLVVSVLVNIGLIVAYIPSGDQIAGLVDKTDSLSLQNVQLRQQLSLANASLQGSSCSLDFYRTQLARTANGSAGSLPVTGMATMMAPSVSQSVRVVRNGPFAEQIVVMNGSIMNISVTAQPGQGRVLVVTKPLMGVVFQDAANTAVAVAQNRTHADLSGTDILFSIEADREVSSVDGPSAGSLMTLLVIAALTHRTIDPAVTLTGTILLFSAPSW